MSEKPLLEMIGIDKTFGRQAVLKNCSLTVQRGETVVLIGPSGSGKSTLLRCVNMLSPADSGDVFFASQHISRGDVPAHKLRQRIGMVFQNYELFSHLTAAENIMLAPMTVLGMNRIDARNWRTTCWQKCASTNVQTIFRTSSPADSSSAWRLPGRWR